MNATASETSIGQTFPVGPSHARTAPAAAYFGASVCVALATLIGEIIIGYFDIATLTLLYLLPVLASALRWGRGPSLFASLLGVLALDFFFVPPLYSFAVASHKDLAALAIFLLVGIVTGSMATKARSEAEKTRQREKRNLPPVKFGICTISAISPENLHRVCRVFFVLSRGYQDLFPLMNNFNTYLSRSAY